jgi:hypothetical protein
MKLRIVIAVWCALCEIGLLSGTLYAVLFDTLRVAVVCLVFTMGSVPLCAIMYCGIKDEWERNRAAARAMQANASAQ